MAKKRKPDSTRLDEVDRSMYTSFTTAANSLSQLYTQAMNQQLLAFQAGERNALEKLYHWILRQQENNIRVTPADITAYLQHELDYLPEAPPLYQQQLSQNAIHATPVPSNTFGQANAGQGPTRQGSLDQTKNSVFCSALSSPVCGSLQQHHFSHSRQYTNNMTRSSENNVNGDHNDCLMDMHADSPGSDSLY